MHIRPCFLVVDFEHASNISTRKLVLETAKYNVITAYSFEEADALLRRFPKVSGMVINGISQDQYASRLLEIMHGMPEVKLIVVGDGPLSHGPRLPDLVVESFAPQLLLEGLQRLFPAETRQILEHERELEQDQH